MEIFDYRGETFSPPPCEQLICGICHAVLFNPLECPCQHVFCKNCIEQWLHKQRSCPECRKPINAPLAQASRLIRNIIQNLKVQCTNASQGCQEVCSVEYYEAHCKVCPYQTIQCSNGKCESEILLKDKTEHEDTECLFYYTTCTVCKKSILRHKLLDHDCFGVLETDLYSLRRRVSALEDEKGLLQCQIRDVNKKHMEMLEGIIQAQHELGNLKEEKCAQENAAISILQKEVEALRNLVDTLPKPAQQNASSYKKFRNYLHVNVLPLVNGIPLHFCIGVLLIWFLYQIFLTFFENNHFY